MCTKPNLIISYLPRSNGFGENKHITKFLPGRYKSDLEKEFVDDDIVEYTTLPDDFDLESFLKRQTRLERWYELERNGEIEDLKITPVGCRKCKECRNVKKGQDAARIFLDCEQVGFENAYFITLTYNEFSIPSDGSLHKEHLQKFMKRLREFEDREFASKVRFYAIGEYGPKNLRPHFHIIVNGCVLRDLKYFMKNALGQPLFRSEVIEKLWPYGFILVGECCYDTCAYVAGYVLKKAIGKKQRDALASLGLKPEFALQSLKPGLGLGHVDRNNAEDVLRILDKYYSPAGVDENGIPLFTDCVTLPAVRDQAPLRVQPPRYCDKLLKEYDPERYELVTQARREKAEQKHVEVLKQTGMTEDQYYSHQDKIKERDKRGFLRNFLFQIS